MPDTSAQLLATVSGYFGRTQPLSLRASVIALSRSHLVCDLPRPELTPPDRGPPGIGG